MAALWPHSNVQFRDLNNDPMVGMQAYFYDAGTSTPQPVYTTADLSVTHDQPVESDIYGKFPAVFLNPTPGSYRSRVVDADDDVAPGWDVDDISVPQDADFVPPDAGDTSEELLFRTGMRIGFYGTTAPSGWVRAAGRTIGSASSGATERANADCEDLFVHLWTVDSTLSVSGGRGASAAGDWAANKTIALPDYRERVAAGMATMGNADAGLIADSLLDGGETSSTLGATGGADDVALTTAQLAQHNHTATFTGAALPTHDHDFSLSGSDGAGTMARRAAASQAATDETTAVSAGTPTGTVAVADTGSGAAHTNLQPTTFELIIIKL